MMNLQALYDLKERLEHAAIAGTSLLQEDFRLRHAAEALAPLANANPVFAKILAGTKALLAAPEQERSTKLLDVLSLVDAVVYTQGITNIAGELTEAAPGTGSYVQISFGQLQPLLTALSGTGSGRLSLIKNHYSEHPEHFRDFRVLPYALKALGDNYAELTQLIGSILKNQGDSVIPLLKDGFDPAGQTDMARRVRIITEISGGKENDWYVAILPDSEKNVREAVIQALSLSQKNARLLLDLCQSERGKLKEAALRSLASMQEPEAEALWDHEIRKKPKLAACLNGVDSIIAADASAFALRALLEELLAGEKNYSHADAERIVLYTSAAVGKYSEKMEQLWYWIAGQMDSFAAVGQDKNVYMTDLNVAEHLQRIFMETVLGNPCPEICSLAKKLGNQNREWFLGCAMLARMGELSPEELYETYASMIVREGLFKRESKEQRNDRIQILQALSAVRWDPESHEYVLETPAFDALNGSNRVFSRGLGGLDPRWISLLTDPKVKLDGESYEFHYPGYYRKIRDFTDSVMLRLVDHDNPQIRETAARWFHRQILERASFSRLTGALESCGWKEWRGMIAACARKRGEIGYAEVMLLIRSLPMTNMEKAAELKELNDMVNSGKLKIADRRWTQENISRYIAILESDPNATI